MEIDACLSPPHPQSQLAKTTRRWHESSQRDMSCQLASSYIIGYVE